MDLGGIKVLLALLGGALALILAPPLGELILWLLVLMGLDAFLALLANGKRGQLDERMGYLGYRRKGATIALILAIAILQRMAQRSTGVDLSRLPPAAFFTVWFGVFEAISVGRNYLRCGGWLPPQIKTIFKDWAQTGGLPNLEPETPTLRR